MFDKKNSKKILKELNRYLINSTALTCEDFNYNELQLLIDNSNLKQYFPNISEIPNILIEYQSKEVVLKDENNKLCFPIIYRPYIEFLSNNYSISKISDKNIIEQVWQYFESIMQLFFIKKKGILLQLEKVLKDSDRHYTELRQRMQNLKNKYEGDRTFEFIFLLPDIFVYIIRLIFDEKTPIEYKVEVALSLLYLVSPIDLIPELWIKHPVAYMDDLGIILLIMIRGFDKYKISQKLFSQHWPGEQETIDHIRALYVSVSNVVGVDLINNIFMTLNKKINPQFEPSR